MSFRSSLKMKQGKFMSNQLDSHTICTIDQSFAHEDSSFSQPLKFQSNQHFQAIEFVDQTIPEKL